MSNIEASEDNTESPTTYGNEAYKKYRERKKKEQVINSTTKWIYDQFWWCKPKTDMDIDLATWSSVFWTKQRIVAAVYTKLGANFIEVA